MRYRRSTAKNTFFQKRTKYAGHNILIGNDEHKGLRYADQIETLSEDYYAGDDGDASEGRTAIFRELLERETRVGDTGRAQEVDKIKRSTRAVLSWFIALAKLGYMGTIATQEIAAWSVRRTCGAPCAIRTFQAATRALLELGYIAVDYCPTGRKTKNDRGLWITLSVCRYTVLPKTLVVAGLISAAPRALETSLGVSAARAKDRARHDALIASCDAEELERGEGPSKPEALQSEDSATTKKPAGVVAQVLRTIADRELSGASQFDDLAPDKLKDNVKKIDKAGNDYVADSGDCIAPGLRGNSTRSSSSTELDPRTSSHKRKPLKKNSGANFYRRGRAQLRRTYAHGRKLLLDEIFTVLATKQSSAEAELAYKIAEAQTDRWYPAALPTALSWEPWILSWIEYDWHKRRRILKDRILPPLRAFISDFARSAARPAPLNRKLSAEEELEYTAAWCRLSNARIPELLQRGLLELNCLPPTQIADLVTLGRYYD